MKNTLVDLRKQAEQAVQDMPESELKTKAFETILSHLLSTKDGHTAESDNGSEKPRSNKTESETKHPPTTLPERILSLKADGFFSSQRSIAEIREELKKNGWHHPVTSMSGPLQFLVQKKHLRRERIDGSWKYSNW